MKRIYFKTFIGSVLFILFLAGCSKILNETPRSTYTAVYFTTTSGVTGGITDLYASLRNLYGNLYYLDACQTGTDETTYGQNADQNFKDLDLSGVGSVTGLSSRSDLLWNNVFPDVNIASGIIQYGGTAGVASSLIAEARFFRAFYYFAAVQTFGGVPLDLGSGVLKFNTSSSRTSVRNTVPEVYTQAIFPDLDTAIANLPTTARLTGTVTKQVAQLFLAKAYLTYGWWLENPNHIPSYPGAYTAGTETRTDPNGQTAQWYYQQAYNMAVAAIQTPGIFGLQTYFYDVSLATKDRNKEIMLYADHELNTQYGGLTSTSYSSGPVGGPDYDAGWGAQWNYTTIRSAGTSTGSFGLSSVQRASVQDLGRPWTELCPPIGIFENTFADKINDSRWDGTFTTVYRCNMSEAQSSGGLASSYTQLYNANYLPITEGSAVLTFLPRDTTVGLIDYTSTTYGTGNGPGNIGAGVMPGRADFVIEPKYTSRVKYPGNWKLGPYRTDNGTGLGNPNAGSIRPWNIAKFSELFFIAAEAAVKGATTSAVTGTYANDGTARGLINVIRARAGRWYWSHAGNVAYSVDNSAAMMAATPATIDINFILAERSREYFGEGYRWYDLVRTQTWAQLGTTYTICGTAWTDHTPVTVTRTIPNTYYIRPIPQGQLNSLQMSTALVTAYQNPGYQ